MIDFIKRIILQYGFHRPAPTPKADAWEQAEFFTAHRRKTEKLAALARYIDSARALMIERKNQKKAHLHIAKAIQDACTERLEIEMGRRVWNGMAWVRKEQ